MERAARINAEHVEKLTNGEVKGQTGSLTALPIIDGQDVGQAVVRAALAPLSTPYTSLNIVGPEVPTAREIINYIAEHYHYPRPLFSLPMPIAHGYAWMIEKVYRLLLLFAENILQRDYWALKC